MFKTTLNTAEMIILELCRDASEYLQCVVEWDKLTEEELWCELVGCILGSQVSWDHSRSALKQLHLAGLLDRNRLLVENSFIEMKIHTELLKPIYASIQKNGSACKYRFPKTKAKQICRTALNIYYQHNSLSNLLRNSRSDYDARIKLMNACHGIGPKQASLFLRNIGFSDRLAILDSHVLKFMRKKGLMSVKTESNVSKRRYFELEASFSRYANLVGTKSCQLDMAIWTVMRLAEVT